MLAETGSSSSEDEVFFGPMGSVEKRKFRRYKRRPTIANFTPNFREDRKLMRYSCSSKSSSSLHDDSHILHGIDLENLEESANEDLQINLSSETGSFSKPGVYSTSSDTSFSSAPAAESENVVDDATSEANCSRVPLVDSTHEITTSISDTSCSSLAAVEFEHVVDDTTSDVSCTSLTSADSEQTIDPTVPIASNSKASTADCKNCDKTTIDYSAVTCGDLNTSITEKHAADFVDLNNCSPEVSSVDEDLDTTIGMMTKSIEKLRVKSRRSTFEHAFKPFAKLNTDPIPSIDEENPVSNEAERQLGKDATIDVSPEPHIFIEKKFSPMLVVKDVRPDNDILYTTKETVSASPVFTKGKIKTLDSSIYIQPEIADESMEIMDVCARDVSVLNVSALPVPSPTLTEPTADGTPQPNLIPENDLFSGFGEENKENSSSGLVSDMMEIRNICKNDENTDLDFDHETDTSDVLPRKRYQMRKLREQTPDPICAAEKIHSIPPTTPASTGRSTRETSTTVRRLPGVRENSAHERGTPASVRRTPVSTSRTPSNARGTPRVKGTPASVKGTHVKGTPASVRGTPASYRGTPASVKKTPASVRGTPASVRGTPASVRGTPASVRGTTTSYRGTTTSYRGTPSSVRGTPASYRGTPASVSEGTASNTKTSARKPPPFKIPSRTPNPPKETPEASLKKAALKMASLTNEELEAVTNLYTMCNSQRQAKLIGKPRSTLDVQSPIEARTPNKLKWWDDEVEFLTPQPCTTMTKSILARKIQSDTRPNKLEPVVISKSREYLPLPIKDAVIDVVSPNSKFDHLDLSFN